MTDLADLPAEVALAVDERVTLPLTSYAGAGLAWSVTCLGDEQVADVAVEVGVPPEPEPSEGPPTPTLAPETLVVVGRSPGQVAWRVLLARSFDPDHPSVDEVLTVRVSDGPPGSSSR